MLAEVNGLPGYRLALLVPISKLNRIAKSGSRSAGWLKANTLYGRTRRLPAGEAALHGSGSEDIEFDITLSPETSQRTDTVDVPAGPFDQAGASLTWHGEGSYITNRHNLRFMLF